MRLITITKGNMVLVDDEDFEYLNHWKWQMHTGGYAYRTTGNTGNRRVIYMHREVNKTPRGMITDHINGDKLDNRRSNLRTVNKSKNAINTGLRSTNRSGHKGVSWSKLHNKWESYIWKNNKQIHLGIYDDITDAIKVRKKAEATYHGF